MVDLALPFGLRSDIEVDTDIQRNTNSSRHVPSIVGVCNDISKMNVVENDFIFRRIKTIIYVYKIIIDILKRIQDI